MINKLTTTLNEAKVFALGLSKVALYTAESYPIRLTRTLLKASSGTPQNLPDNHNEILLKQFASMIKEEAQNLNDNIYSSQLVNKFSPLEHIKRYSSIFLDSIDASIRAKYKINKKFSDEAIEDTTELPEYYARNFHYQTDGYLSHKSAELYEHQTEILFQGTLGLMRRLLLAPLIQKINASVGPVTVLEVACGTGETTEILLNSCPNIQLTAVDLSTPYLDAAQKRCSNYSNVTFLKGNASEIQIEEKFDFVVSSYLFHELPLKERKNVLTHLFSLLKEGGWALHIDSIQKNDNPEMNWALEQFPKDFHEPFYKNYTETAMSGLLEESGLIEITEEHRFLSKSVMGRKN